MYDFLVSFVFVDVIFDSLVELEGLSCKNPYLVIARGFCGAICV